VEEGIAGKTRLDYAGFLIIGFTVGNLSASMHLQV